MDSKYISKLSPTVDFCAGIYLVVIAILSIFGNAAVLVSAARRLAGLKAPELLTVNLAVTDIGMALSMYPLSIASAFNHTWVGGDVSCLYYGLMGMIFSITSIMTLAVMGMVRYMVTGSPPRKGIKFHRRTIGSVITGIWLYASLWALLPLLGWGSYGPEPFGLACSIDWIGYEESLNHSTFIMALATLCTFLPCAVILGTYFGIAWKLHRAYQSIQSEDFQCGNIERKITLVKVQFTSHRYELIDPIVNVPFSLQMAFMISSGFIIAWSPYVAVSFWTMFNTQEQKQVAPSVSLLPCLFAKSSTVYNPFIYFFFKRNCWHKPLCFSRQGFSCAQQPSLLGKEEKLATQMEVQGSGYTIVVSATGKPGPGNGATVPPEDQPASEGSVSG